MTEHDRRGRHLVRRSCGRSSGWAARRIRLQPLAASLVVVHRTASDVKALLRESLRGVRTRARIRVLTGGTTTGRSREARIELTPKPGEVAVFDGAPRPAP